MNLLSLKEAATQLQISVITLRRYIKDGKIKAVKVGRSYRIAEEDIIGKVLNKPTRIIEADNLVEKALNDTIELPYHSSRKELMHQAKALYLEAHETKLATRVNHDANIFGYTYTNLFNEGEARRKWGRFAPMGSGTDKDGNELYFPDPRWIDGGMLKHALKRTSETNNPIVLAIYYDLLFEYSKGKDRLPYAKEAVLNYLAASVIHYGNGRMFDFIDNTARALEISIKTGDRKKAEEILVSIFSYVEEIVQHDNPRFSIELLETLVHFSKLLTAAQIKKVISQANAGAKHFAKQGGDSRHLERSFLEIIKQTHHQAKDAEAEKAIDFQIARSYILEAEEKKDRGGLVQSVFFEKAYAILATIGTDKEKEALRQKIELANLQSQDEMKLVSAEIKITEKEKNDFINAVLVEDNIESLKQIGSSPYLIPSIKSAEDLVKDMMKKFPLQYLVSKSSIQDGRKISVSRGGGLELTEDHVIEQHGKSIQFSALFLGFVFEELEKRGLTIDQMIDYLKDKDFFQYENFDAIADGLKSYEQQNYFASLSTLIPQIEQALRRVVRRLGLPTTEIVSNGDQRVIQIGKILEVLRPAFGNDLYWYFNLILSDNRGPGLRHSLAHGLLMRSAQNKMQCYLIIHLLLIMATCSINNEKSH